MLKFQVRPNQLPAEARQQLRGGDAEGIAEESDELNRRTSQDSREDAAGRIMTQGAEAGQHADTPYPDFGALRGEQEDANRERL